MKFSRRTFLKFLAGGAAGALLTPLPWQGLERLARFTQAGPYPLPAKGKEELRPTVSRLCPARTPVTVRLVNGQAVQTLPWEGHPLAGQGLSALAAAEVQMLYRPSRLQTPLLKQANGSFKEIDWQEALRLLRAKVEEAGPDLACVCGDENALGAFLWHDFLEAKGSRDFHFMPSDGQAMRQAARLMQVEAQAGYDFENSDCALVVGANLLENWGAVLRNRRLFAGAPFGGEAGNDGGFGNSGSFIFCSALQTGTARAAKQWLPIAPGTEEVFLLGLLHLLIKSKQGRWPGSFAPSEQAALDELLAQHTPKQVAAACALPENNLKAVASQLLNAKRPLLVAGTSLGAGGSLALPMLVWLGNAWLGNVNKPGGLQLLPDLWAGKTPGDFASFVTAMAAPAGPLAKDRPKVLIFNECNPMYSLPAWVRANQSPAGQNNGESAPANLVATANLLGKVPFKVALSVFANETTAASDLVLPLPSAFERWDQVYSPYGCGEAVYNICPPVITRQTNSRSVAELLHYLRHGQDALANFFAKGQTPDGLLSPLPAEEAIMKRLCKDLQADYEKLRQGLPYVCQHREQPSRAMTGAMTGTMAGTMAGATCSSYLLPVGLCDKKNEKEAKNTGSAILCLLPQTRLALSNASLGLSVYASATLAGRDYAGAESVALLNAATAAAFGLPGGSRVHLSALNCLAGTISTADTAGIMGTGAGLGSKSLAGSGLTVKLHIDESVPFGAISLQSGYGHEHMDAFSNNKGGNLMRFYALQREAGGGATVFVALPVVRQAL